MDYNSFQMNDNNPFLMPNFGFPNPSFELPAQQYQEAFFDPNLPLSFPTLPNVSIPADSSALEIKNDDEWKWHIKSNNKLKNGIMARYYVCAVRSCSARKNIKIAPDNSIIDVKYKGEHNHGPSAPSVSPEPENQQLYDTFTLPKWMPNPTFFSSFSLFSDYVKHITIWPSLQLIVATKGGLSMLGSCGSDAIIVPILEAAEPGALEITAIVVPIPGATPQEVSAVPVAFCLTTFASEIDQDIRNRFQILRNLIDISQNRWNPRTILTKIDSSWFLAAKLAFSVNYPEKIGKLPTNLIVNHLNFDAEISSSLNLMINSMNLPETSILRKEIENLYFSENLEIFNEKMKFFEKNLDPENLLFLQKIKNSLISPENYLYFSAKNQEIIAKLDRVAGQFLAEISPLISKILENYRNSSGGALSVVISQIVSLLKKCEENSSVIFSRLRRANNLAKISVIESPENSEEDVEMTTQRVRELDSVSSSTVTNFPEFLMKEKTRR